jgi:hypothetical protein
MGVFLCPKYKNILIYQHIFCIFSKITIFDKVKYILHNY